MAVRERNRRIAREFAGLTDLEKVQAAESVAETMGTPGWEFIVQVLEDRRSSLLNDLVRRVGVKSEAEYAAAVAEVRGIECALDAGQTVLHAGKASAQKLSESEGTV